MLKYLQHRRQKLGVEKLNGQGIASKMRSNVLMVSLLVLCVVAQQFGKTLAQSNYVQQGDSGNYTTNGLPEEATLDGKVSYKFFFFFLI